MLKLKTFGMEGSVCAKRKIALVVYTDNGLKNLSGSYNHGEAKVVKEKSFGKGVLSTCSN